MSDYYEGDIALALDLLNSHDPYLDDPEKLGDTDALASFLTEHGIEARPIPPTTADLTEVRALRTRMWEAFTARHAPDGPARLAELARELRTAPVIGDGFDLHWRPVDEETHSIADRLRARAVLGLASALDRHGPERLKSCAAAPCQEVFVDTLRNRSRRFCSQRCANRHHVAAFRQRQ